MKIWLKVVIVGVIIFFAGVFYSASLGGLMKAPQGMIISVIGVILMAVGILTGLTRGFRRMMNE
ncbi:MAG: hypothetical protein EPO37_01455 [Nitrosarchaeum sp.]|nr:MAG: hypothetical protein EPO37_01455 [Nitrosarchaeum sp.]